MDQAAWGGGVAEPHAADRVLTIRQSTEPTARAASGGRARVARLAVPIKNEKQVADFLLSQGIAAFVGTQILTVSNFEEAKRLAGTTLDDDTKEMLTLFGAVTLLLLIAIANVASLVTTFTRRRHHELALRRAIGATLPRLLCQQLALVLEATGLGERDVPDYVEVDHSKMTAKLSRLPALGDVPYPVMMEPHLVVEYYSR